MFLIPKQLPINPKKLLLGFMPALVWLVYIWAEANPMMVNVNNVTVIKVINIFVFYHHITVWSLNLIVVW